MVHAILTALGADRPGLVDEVSQFIFDRGGNIEDSRMVNLRGQFTIMLLVSAEAGSLEKMRGDLEQFAKGSRLHAKLRFVGDERMASEAALSYRLVATAIDQPGIVHRVSHTLRQLQVNIESLDTRLTPAPYTGSPVFEMELIITVPRSVALAQLRQNLGATCDGMNVDWELRPV